MKTFAVALALFLCVFGGVSSAAGQSAKPMPKANVVIIQTSDSAATALRKLAAVFVSQGYTVDKFDKEFLTLTFAPKTLATAFSPILTARASASSTSNSTIRLMGDFKATVLSHSLNDITQFYGSEKGVYMSSFRALERAALMYPAGKVSYSKQ